MTLLRLKRRVALLMDATEDDYQVGILRGISRAAEPTNVCLAAYSSARRFRVPGTFRASEFGPTDLFAQDGGALLVQPLTFEGVPVGIATVMLSTLDISIFEQLREILGAGLRGFQLAQQARAAASAVP